MAQVQVKKLHTLTGHTDCVYTLEQGGHPARFYSAGADGMVVGWDLRHPEKGDLIARVPQSVYALHYLPEEDFLICGHNQFGIRVIDCAGKREVAALPLSNAAIFDISVYGNQIFVGDGQGVVWVIDRKHWKVISRWVHSEKSARTLAVSPVASELAVGYSDFLIRIFDLKTGAQKQTCQGHENSVFSLAYTPDYQQLLSGSRDARLRVWRAASGYAEEGQVAAHLYAINHLTFSPDGKHFVTCSLDKTIKVWYAKEMKLLKVIDKARHAGHSSSVNKLCWTSFDQLLVSASDDRTLGIWEIIF